MDAPTEAEVRAKAARARTELAETETAFAELRAAYLEQIVRTEPTDATARERLYWGARVIDDVLKALKDAVAHGKAADYARAAREMAGG